jgi:hypothetical protein
MKSKVYTGYVSKQAKADQFIKYDGLCFTVNADYFWSVDKNKRNCIRDFDKDHLPPQKITITVELD